MSATAFVIGAGGIGLFFADALEQAGHKVAVCVRSPVERFVIEMREDERTLSAQPILDANGLTPARWVVITTKAQDTAGAASWLTRLCGPETILVVAQNGIDQVERVRPFAGGAAIVPALVYGGFERVGPGRVRHHSGLRVDVPAGPGAAALERLLAGSAVTLTQNPDFLTGAWRKLLNNITGNPITALTQGRNGILREPDMQDLCRAILQEAVTVARAAGANLSEGDINDVIAFYGTIPPDGGTSMLYDRLAGRPLEHEYLTGAVVRAASRHGIEVPINRAIYTLLRGLSAGLASTDAHAPEQGA